MSVATVVVFVFVITVFCGVRITRGRVVVCTGVVIEGGIVPAIVGVCIDPVGAALALVVAGNVNAVVVSAFVPVSGTAVAGGGVSPGPLIVDVTESVCPS